MPVIKLSRRRSRKLPPVHLSPIDKMGGMQWLDLPKAEERLLVTPPANSFIVEEVGAKLVQNVLAF